MEAHEFRTDPLDKYVCKDYGPGRGGEGRGDSRSAHRNCIAEARSVSGRPEARQFVTLANA